MRENLLAKPNKVLIKSFTWNIEGIKRNIFSLQYFVRKADPNLIFISEPQIFQFDLKLAMKHLSGEYDYSLNSDDKFDPELGLLKTKAHGGTMILWKKKWDKYISTYTVDTSCFLPIIFSLPGAPVTIHVALYLPTSGKEVEFLEELSKLKLCIDDLLLKFPGSLIYLRGDCNVNYNNKNRAVIFNNMIASLKMVNIKIKHRTYHHFMGNGLFDSNIDVIIHSKSAESNEEVLEIFCQSEFPIINSHHDPILSAITVPIDDLGPSQDDLVSAPKVPNNRVRVVWSEENILSYQQAVSEPLSDLRNRWTNHVTKSSFSLLLEVTSKILTSAAAVTNKTKALDKVTIKKSAKVPLEIRSAQKALTKAFRSYKVSLDSTDANVIEAKVNLKNAKREFRTTIRRLRNDDNIARDHNLSDILLRDPRNAYRSIKSSMSSGPPQVPFLTVGDRNYVGDRVADGFFDSISALKTKEVPKFPNEASFNNLQEDYSHILDLCMNKRDLPYISMEKSNKILGKMKATVTDFFNITPLHYLNAGQEGLIHFNFFSTALLMMSITHQSKSLTLFTHFCYIKVIGSQKRATVRIELYPRVHF